MAAESTVTPNVKQAVPFFMVTDIEASLRFYVDGLGFAMTVASGKGRWSHPVVLASTRQCGSDASGVLGRRSTGRCPGRPSGAGRLSLLHVRRCDCHLPRSYFAGSRCEAPVCWEWSMGDLSTGSRWLSPGFRKPYGCPGGDRLFRLNPHDKQRHDKSLDASGGSVFLNLLGAAKGALIRAAASTPPLCCFTVGG
jgi:hypothetical protein